jgi:hypothetical protein
VHKIMIVVSNNPEVNIGLKQRNRQSARCPL